MWNDVCGDRNNRITEEWLYCIWMLLQWLVSTTHYNFINTLDDAGLCQVLEILAVKEKQTIIS